MMLDRWKYSGGTFMSDHNSVIFGTILKKDNVKMEVIIQNCVEADFVTGRTALVQVE